MPAPAGIRNSWAIALKDLCKSVPIREIATAANWGTRITLTFLLVSNREVRAAMEVGNVQ
jgi:hypothetical protein